MPQILSKETLMSLVAPSRLEIRAEIGLREESTPIGGGMLAIDSRGELRQSNEKLALSRLRQWYQKRTK